MNQIVFLAPLIPLAPAFMWWASRDALNSRWPTHHNELIVPDIKLPPTGSITVDSDNKGMVL